MERDVHCKVRPKDGLDAGMGIWIVLVRWPFITINANAEETSLRHFTFALHRPSVTVLPAQLRTSWAKRLGSESS